MDFFGAAVKAGEMLGHARCMRTLQGKLSPLTDPGTQFRLAADSLPPLPKWAKDCGWTARDDSMLLLGIYRWGKGQPAPALLL